jgi:exoribonuclease R
MEQYKIIIEDRNCDGWSLTNTITLEDVSLKEFNPLSYKLFNGDIFTYNNGEFTLIHSCTKSMNYLSGVLVLEKNKSYGKYKDKQLYKCLPDDRRIPSFLIPYEIKKIGFSKIYKNKYVTFGYSHWDHKHPYGKLLQVIGEVDKLENFYEYQLYCKSLNASIQGFTRATSQALKLRSRDEFIDLVFEKYPNIENRIESHKIFTIDSETTQDYDDAIGIKKVDDTYTIVSIYISNVIIWMELLELWDSFSERISTIYLPDRKRPMMPTVLSECLCSLQENETRFAFTMDIHIKNNMIDNVTYCNSAIKIYRNFVYDTEELLKDEEYKNIYSTLKGLSINKKYVPKIKQSGDVITYLMILMNHRTGMELLKINKGIFRSAVFTPKVKIPEHLPESVYKFLHNWSNFSGQYVLDVPESHELLELECYIHITSPIRRLVDLLNMIKLHEVFNLFPMSDKVSKFYDNWTERIEHINITMRAIRKVQVDCNLLEMCMNDNEILKKDYDGYMFDKMVRNDGLYQYMVFLPDLKMTSKITIRDDVENYANCKFNIHIFTDQDRLKKKIRLQIL